MAVQLVQNAPLLNGLYKNLGYDIHNLNANMRMVVPRMTDGLDEVGAQCAKEIKKMPLLLNPTKAQDAKLKDAAKCLEKLTKYTRDKMSCGLFGKDSSSAVCKSLTDPYTAVVMIASIEQLILIEGSKIMGREFREPNLYDPEIPLRITYLIENYSLRPIQKAYLKAYQDLVKGEIAGALRGAPKAGDPIPDPYDDFYNTTEGRLIQLFAMMVMTLSASIAIMLSFILLTSLYHIRDLSKYVMLKIIDNAFDVTNFLILKGLGATYYIAAAPFRLLKAAVKRLFATSKKRALTMEDIKPVYDALDKLKLENSGKKKPTDSSSASIRRIRARARARA